MDQMTTPPCANANPPALSELGAMGDEELNDTLAPLSGWTFTLSPTDEEMRDAREGLGAYKGMAGYPIGGGPLGGLQYKHWKTPSGKHATRPNYTRDANAVAEVRMGLSEIERFRFANHVSKLITGNDHQCSSFALIDASPRLQTIALILCKTH